MMNSYRWISNESRIIPGFGKLTQGDTRAMPKHVGESYVAQGLMEEIKPSVKSSKHKKEDLNV